MSPPRIAVVACPAVVIVGLGPAGADHLLPVARAALASASQRSCAPRATRRSRSSPRKASRSSRSTPSTTPPPDLDAAYDRDGRALLAAAARWRHGRLRGARQPCSRRAHRRAAARGRRARVRRACPGLSFTDLAWARLGVDPMARDARVVDGRAIDDAELAGPLLIAQCDNAFVLSDVKLALLEHLDPDTPVTVLQRLGPPRRARRGGRARRPRPHGRARSPHVVVRGRRTGAAGAAREIVRLLQLAKRLRDPGGCPWDAEQTHHSLTRYLLEESYEVVRGRSTAVPGARRATPRSRTSSVTCSTRSCSTRCWRRRPAPSPWPTSPRHPRQARAPPSARVR